MIINIGLWQDQGLFGDFGGDGRGVHEPVDQHVLQAVRQRRSTDLPAWPVFETLVGVVLIVRARSTTWSRSAARRTTSRRDAATGEAVIG